MSDGAEALQAYDAHPFDGNILDLGIPEPDGFEELRKIRQRDATTPFLMVTASGTKEQAVQAVSTGAQANVLIPFDLTQLQEGIGASTLPRPSIRLRVVSLSNHGSGASLRANLESLDLARDPEPCRRTGRTACRRIIHERSWFVNNAG